MQYYHGAYLRSSPLTRTSRHFRSVPTSTSRNAPSIDGPRGRIPEAWPARRCRRPYKRLRAAEAASCSSMSDPSSPSSMDSMSIPSSPAMRSSSGDDGVGLSNPQISSRSRAMLDLVNKLHAIGFVLLHLVLPSTLIPYL